MLFVIVSVDKCNLVGIVLIYDELGILNLPHFVEFQLLKAAANFRELGKIEWSACRHCFAWPAAWQNTSWLTSSVSRLLFCIQLSLGCDVGPSRSIIGKAWVAMPCQTVQMMFNLQISSGGRHLDNVQQIQLHPSHSVALRSHWLSNNGVAVTPSTGTRTQEAPCNKEVAESHCAPEHRQVTNYHFANSTWKAISQWPYQKKTWKIKNSSQFIQTSNSGWMRWMQKKCWHFLAETAKTHLSCRSGWWKSWPAGSKPWPTLVATACCARRYLNSPGRSVWWLYVLSVWWGFVFWYVFRFWWCFDRFQSALISHSYSWLKQASPLTSTPKSSWRQSECLNPTTNYNVRTHQPEWQHQLMAWPFGRGSTYTVHDHLILKHTLLTHPAPWNTASCRSQNLGL